MYNMVIIDGLSILFRSFYAMKDMRNSKNQHIGAVYGFTRCCLSMIEIYRPEYLIVALDTKQKTWRHEALEEYKSTRKPTPPDLIPQFTMMREACKALGVSYYEGSAAEADDWIASCVESYAEVEKMLIVSADKDLLQLVSEKVHVYDPGKKVVLKSEDVLKRWGVVPTQICDLLALSGDGADCVGGVKGIGLKTASKWLNEYLDLEGILENIALLKPLSRRNMLMQGIESAIKSRSLIKLQTTLEVLPIEKMKITPCVYGMKQFLEDHEMTFISKAEKIMGKYFAVGT